MFDEIDRLASEGPTAVEFARAHQQLEAQHLLQLENAEGRAQAVGHAALVTGNPDAVYEKLGHRRRVTAEDIQRVVRAYLIPSRRTVVWVVPAKGDRS
jgi:predicted Zn-dependent peptidase